MRKIFLIMICIMTLSAWLLPQDVIDISPLDAFELSNKADTNLIDVRTIAEYVYIGHPENAYSLPLLFWDEKEQTQVRNDDFLRDLASRFKKEDTLVFICRSTNRSPVAARMAVDSGFLKVFNVKEGIEGKKDENGYRTIEGWKNRGLPYTYKLKAELVYRK